MTEINSDETSSRDELKSETLDQLYKEQVSELRNSVLKTCDTSAIDVCCKWINVFNCIPRAEKIDRNCLCTLMQQQINEYGRLASPFTDLSNCKKDLKTVLQELDKPSCSSTNKSLQTESVATFNSHRIKCIPADQRTASEISESNTEYIELKHKLESLRLQLVDQQIENAKLKEIVKNQDKGLESSKMSLDNIKADILNSIREKLLHMDDHYTEEQRNKLNLFHTIFAVHSNDEEFMEHIRKFDIDLEYILKKNMDSELSKRKATMLRQIFKKFLKKQTKMHEKYERRLSMQAVAQKLQIKLTKLKCFSVLRQIFMRSHSESGKVDLWDVLRILEDKYQTVVNDI